MRATLRRDVGRPTGLAPAGERLAPRLYALCGWCIALACLPVGPGCHGSRRKAAGDEYRTLGKEPKRDSDLARDENARAIALLEERDWEGAERALRAALAADVMHGPAHNNLGKVYYHQGKLYLAAWEFQYAAKLMPNQPEPKNNLGLVF